MKSPMTKTRTSPRGWTSLGRSHRRPKESSERSKFPTAGDIAAELEAEEAAPAEALTTDVDGPSYEDAAVPALAEFAVAEEAVAPVKPKREKKVRPPKEPRPAKEPKALKEPKPAKAPKPPKTPKPPKLRTGNANRRWTIAAGVVGAIGLLFSVVLATGALFIALDAGQGGAFFAHLSDACDALVGPLKDVFSFSGVNAGKKQALVGWGLGSMGYLLVGRFIQSVFMSRVKD